jgi:putative GTP pyrophosphokinase
MALWPTRDPREVLGMGKDFDDEYALAVAPLSEFGKSLESLIKQLLAAKGIPFHQVGYRVKLQDSAERKMARPRQQATGAGPRTLESFTDLLGVRVVTYFRDGIDDVAEVMRDEFTIDWQNSVDKRATLDDDRFGYLSMHYVAKLKPDCMTPKYENYGGIKFEIQIRSILQHAWAEMEHDLGYKSEAAIPRDFRRRFSRLAGVLELVDDEFVGIQKAIKDYQVKAKTTIDKGSFGLGIDQDSLSAFVQSSERVGRLDRLIAELQKTSMQRRPDKQYLGRRAGELMELGFGSIADLDNYLDENWALLARFTGHWLSLTDQTSRAGRTTVPVGITLYYAEMLKTVQEEGDGNTAAKAFLASKPELLRQALVAAAADLEADREN